MKRDGGSEENMEGAKRLKPLINTRRDDLGLIYHGDCGEMGKMKK